MRCNLFLGPVLLFCLLVGGAVLHKYSIVIRGKAVADQLSATTLDLTIESKSPEIAFKELERKLKEKSDFFRTCRFEYAVSQPNEAQIWLEVSDTSGLDCLHYVTELAGLRFHLRRGTILITNWHVDTRDVVERTVDSTKDWFENTSRWAKYKLGVFPPLPPLPSDPFAPPPEVSQFPVIRETP
jgi:hypothetical protein